jgi:hypothetical protein
LFLTAASVDMFNKWFMNRAPKEFRDTRVLVTKQVEETLIATNDLSAITLEILRSTPGILPTLRMAESALIDQLSRLIWIIDRMLDRDIFPWLATNQRATDEQRHRASTIVADRLCSAVANPIIRNAQEKRQKAAIETFLTGMEYRKKQPPPGQLLTDMEPGTFWFGMNLIVGVTSQEFRIPIDAVIQPMNLRPSRLPVLIEAKSAGDFTDTNKRRKEEATKAHQLRLKYGDDVEFVLFLCGYFDAGYLG